MVKRTNTRCACAQMLLVVSTCWAVVGLSGCFRRLVRESASSEQVVDASALVDRSGGSDAIPVTSDAGAPESGSEGALEVGPATPGGAEAPAARRRLRARRGTRCPSPPAC